MGFSRQEYWSGLPFPSPGDLPHPGVEPGFPALQQTLYPLSHEITKVVLYWDSSLQVSRTDWKGEWKSLFREVRKQTKTEAQQERRHDRWTIRVTQRLQRRVQTSPPSPPFAHHRACYCLVAKLYPTLCDPIDYSPQGSTVHEMSQAKILEWVAISFSTSSWNSQQILLPWTLFIKSIQWP